MNRPRGEENQQYKKENANAFLKQKIRLTDQSAVKPQLHNAVELKLS